MHLRGATRALASALRAVRDNRGLSQTELAQAIGSSRPSATATPVAALESLDGS